MDLNTIQWEFGRECKCERDVVAKCVEKTTELKNALKVLGIDISKSNGLQYIYTYFILKLKDCNKEGIEIDKFQIKNEDKTPISNDDFKMSKEEKEIMKYIVGEQE